MTQVAFDALPEWAGGLVAFYHSPDDWLHYTDADGVDWMTGWNQGTQYKIRK